MNTLQKKSHEALLKLLNNIGIVGAVLTALADIILVVIMVVGLDIKIDMKTMIIFACISALSGLMINNLLRYQGKHYAELENDELCKKFYNKKVREKKHLTIEKWMAVQGVKDFLIKGCTTAFSIFGAIYITIQGSKNAVQILIAFATLIMFACFGLVAMNSAYCRFYNIQVPYMKKTLEEREKTATNKKKKCGGKKSNANKERQDLQEPAGASVSEPGVDQSDLGGEGCTEPVRDQSSGSSEPSIAAPGCERLP